EMLGSNEWLHAMTAFQASTGWNHSEGVDKWRFVGTGIVDGPWDTRLSGILTLASGGAFRGFVESGTNGAPASRFIPGAYFPAENIAFKMLDLKISKDFNLSNGHAFSIEGQVFNAADWVNKTYNEWGSGFSNAANPVATRKGNNSTTGPARSYQIGLKYKW
ncbi:MAG: TonB-dependent receptor, partial [Caulobacterales bacterium]|nr:TonB-dependent receptor [Caulobacterales bacterium]